LSRGDLLRVLGLSLSTGRWICFNRDNMEAFAQIEVGIFANVHADIENQIVSPLPRPGAWLLCEHINLSHGANPGLRTHQT
jgi:hypothetical protein